MLTLQVIEPLRHNASWKPLALTCLRWDPQARPTAEQLWQQFSVWTAPLTAQASSSKPGAAQERFAGSESAARDAHPVETPRVKKDIESISPAEATTIPGLVETIPTGSAGNQLPPSEAESKAGVAKLPFEQVPTGSAGNQLPTSKAECQAGVAEPPFDEETPSGAGGNQQPLREAGSTALIKEALAAGTATDSGGSSQIENCKFEGCGKSQFSKRRNGRNSGYCFAHLEETYPVEVQIVQALGQAGVLA